VSAYRFIAAERANHPVALMCRVLQVSTSGFYEWCGRPPSARSLADRALLEQIREVHERSRHTYGAPRICAELRASGTRVSRKRVARLMARAAICGVHLRKAWRRPGTAVRVVAPDLVRRRFDPPAPDRIWAADITYVGTRRGWAHLAVVMDLHSRRVVGWQVAPHLRTPLVTGALDMAITRRRPDAGLVLHSDNGAQFVSAELAAHLARHGIVASMGRPGTAYDNAVVESFFSTIKREHLRRCRFADHRQARASIGEWIECFYNPARRHSKLGYRSPEEFENDGVST
jgi:transposase InsO family protein